jgi:hypothetical protein
MPRQPSVVTPLPIAREERVAAVAPEPQAAPEAEAAPAAPEQEPRLDMPEEGIASTGPAEGLVPAAHQQEADSAPPEEPAASPAFGESMAAMREEEPKRRPDPVISPEDEALLRELEVMLDPTDRGSGEKPNRGPNRDPGPDDISLEEEMSRLLGDLSGERR